jgi:hypothetical protein
VEIIAPSFLDSFRESCVLLIAGRGILMGEKWSGSLEFCVAWGIWFEKFLGASIKASFLRSSITGRLLPMEIVGN